MKKELKIVIALMLCVAWTLSASAQTTVESIRKEYQAVQQDIALMMPNEDGETPSPPVYYDLNVSQNLPAQVRITNISGCTIMSWMRTKMRFTHRIICDSPLRSIILQPVSFTRSTCTTQRDR